MVATNQFGFHVPATGPSPATHRFAALPRQPDDGRGRLLPWADEGDCNVDARNDRRHTRVGKDTGRRHGGRARSSPSKPTRTRPAHQPRQFRQRPRGPLYGALDLGTNNCRLLIAAPRRQGLHVVDAFSRIVRLGEGFALTGRLGEEAMRRTISALRVCANKLRWWRVDDARLIATEACRAAENGGEFIDRVARETGLQLTVIDRETEARLAVSGASALLEPSVSDVVVFDIGGGSSELMWLSHTENGREIVEWTSIPAGVVSISERYGGVDVDEETYQRMRAHVRSGVRRFAEAVAKRGIDIAAADHLLGTSGTVTTICGVHLGLRRYDRSRVDGSWLRCKDIEQVTASLRAMDYEARRASPCIGGERADLVLAGCAILEEIRSLWPNHDVRVADRGLREGILTNLMREAGEW